MSKNTDEVFIGTDARIILSDWPALSELVVKHGKLIKEQIHESADGEDKPLPEVISRREIEDALSGPLQRFFKQKITAYSKISRVRLELTIREDETLRDKRATQNDAEKVPESIIEHTSIADLNKTQQELDDLTRQHEEAWQQLREDACANILEQLNQNGLSLSEIEIKEFLDPEPLSELLERYVTLNIELPKAPKTEMNLSKYLTFKTNISVHSALSRQHKPNTQNDIQKELNKLKTNFNSIAKQESELLDNQKSATNEVIANVSW